MLYLYFINAHSALFYLTI